MTQFSDVKRAMCAKCGLGLSYFPDPDDDEARNWANDEVGSYCPADGFDHEPEETSTS